MQPEAESDEESASEHTLCHVSVIAQPLHELVDGGRNGLYAKAGALRRRGEPKAGQRRCDHMEGHLLWICIGLL